jgi:hypothetical protein
MPGEAAVSTSRPQLLAEDRDRALAGIVHEREGPPRRLGLRNCPDADTVAGQLGTRAAAELVGSQGRKELARPGQASELDGGNRPAPGRLLPGLERVRDVARPRHRLDAGELDPLHVTHDRDAHGWDPHT